MKKMILSIAILLIVSSQVNAQVASALNVYHSSSLDDPFTTSDGLIKAEVKSTTTLGLPDYWYGINLWLSTYESSFYAYQLNFNYNGMYFRHGHTTSWASWRKVLWQDVEGDASIDRNLDVKGRVFIPSGQSYWIGAYSDSGNRLRMHHNGSNAYIDYEPNLFFRAGTNTIASFLSDGKIGIGIDTPTNKLEVNGTIRAKEVKIDTGWADHVFTADYQLPALSEVKQFIDENKHLPGIPTETEVKENGVNLGEMQVKLLQKIEELTLYAIKQQELIDKLNTRIEQLENK